MAEKTTKINKIVQYLIIGEAEKVKKEREEQERTRIKKKLFLDYFKRLLGVISAACKGAEIDRGTYYNWKKDDPEFARAVSEIQTEECEEVEGRLKKGILKDSMRAITFFLEKRHPFYKPTMKIKEVVGNKTLEDLIWEDEERLNQGNEDTKKTEDKPGADRKAPVDPGQARGDGSVQVKPGPKNILGKEDPKKPVAKAKAEGAE